MELLHMRMSAYSDRLRISLTLPINNVFSRFWLFRKKAHVGYRLGIYVQSNFKKRFHNLFLFIYDNQGQRGLQKGGGGVTSVSIDLPPLSFPSERLGCELGPLRLRSVSQSVIIVNPCQEEEEELYTHSHGSPDYERERQKSVFFDVKSLARSHFYHGRAWRDPRCCSQGPAGYGRAGRVPVQDVDRCGELQIRTKPAIKILKNGQDMAAGKWHNEGHE